MKKVQQLAQTTRIFTKKASGMLAAAGQRMLAAATAFALLLAMLPAVMQPLAATEGAAPSAPTGSVDSSNQFATVCNFFANGTPISVEAQIPDGAQKGTVPGYQEPPAENVTAYIVWQQNETTYYVPSGSFYESGKRIFYHIYGGTNGGTLDGSTSITINGGTLCYIHGGCMGEGSKVTGDVSIVVNDGSMEVIYGTYYSVIGGEVKIQINDGEITSSIYAVQHNSSDTKSVSYANIDVNGGNVGAIYPINTGNIGFVQINISGGTVEYINSQYGSSGSTEQTVINITGGNVINYIKMQKSTDKLYISGGSITKPITGLVTPVVSEKNSTGLKKYRCTLPDTVAAEAPVSALAATSPALSYEYGVNETVLSGNTLSMYLPDSITEITVKIGEKYYTGTVSNYAATLAETTISNKIELLGATSLTSATGSTTVQFQSAQTAPSQADQLVVYKNGNALQNGTDYVATTTDNRSWNIAFKASAALNNGSELTVSVNRSGYLTVPNAVQIKNEIPGFTPVKGTHYTASSNDWAKEFKITAASGYTISSSKTAGFGASLSFSDDTASGSAVFYLKDTATGEISAAATESYKIDKTAPTVSMAIKGETFSAQSGSATYTIFAKDRLDATVTASDATSKIAKTEYQKVASIDQFNESNPWTSFTNTISLTEKGSFVLFVRATDNAGNKTIINSTQLALYQNSVAKTTELSCILGESTDKTAEVTLNGNVISDIKVDGTSLAADEYSVSDGSITLKGSYLSTLKKGSYTAVVSYDAQNEEYYAGQDKGDVPATTSFKIVVAKAIPKAPIGVTTQTPTTYENKDGAIQNVTHLMEYQKEGDTAWQAITGTTVTGLVSGTYLVRYRETETQGASETAKVVIARFPTTDQTLQNETTEVSGKFTEGAKLETTPLSAGSGYDAIMKLVNTEKNRVIGAFEVKVVNGGYEGKLTLVFAVGTKYDGKTITVYHQKKNGQVETLTAICKDGKVAVTVDELSPFVLTEQIVATTPGTPTNPGTPTTPGGSNAAPTGDGNNMTAMIFLLILSGIAVAAGTGAMLLEKKKKDAKKEAENK